MKQAGKPEIYVGRRYGEFAQMHKKLRLELPGKVLPPLPRKNRAHSLYSSKGDDDDNSSISSVSTQDTPVRDDHANTAPSGLTSGFRSYLPNPFGGHRRTASKGSPAPSPRASIDVSSTANLRFSGEYRDHHAAPPQVLHREDQRVSLRAFLRGFLQNEQIARSSAMTEFLTGNQVHLNEEEMDDVRRRMEMDEKRIEEQRRFYEIARDRARELDVHMEKFKRDIVESSEYPAFL